jgi:uncharacterized caspase-like protein
MDGSVYNAALSKLLESPRLSDVLEALKTLAFEASGTGVLTLYFAGHGCVSKGSFYLAVRDSQANRLSVTGLSIAQLFRVISESQPRIANIVIDACQAAGSVYDLPSLLNPDVIGKAHDSSIVFLGACAADQYAAETDSGGVATTALLRYLKGEARLQDDRPFLDLLELG